MASTQGVRSTLKGVVDSKFNGDVTQYRGIQYATIKKRFAKPVLNTQWQKTTDYTNFGPRCPQVFNDFRNLLLISNDLDSWPRESEDELKCVNLTISCPSDLSLQKLPVIIFFHGGSQMVSFGSAGQRLGNTDPLVAQSIALGKPVVFISVNYRLNVFAFGDSEGELNLDLQDLRVAIEWVKKNIPSFGGDSENITLVGQSAGGVYIHALLTSGTQVTRAILHSGSGYATPMQPDKRGFGVLGLIEGNLQLLEVEKGNMNPGESAEATIAGAPVKALVETVRDLSIKRKWLWEEKNLKDWQQLDKAFGKLKGLMIGDVQAEGALNWYTVNKLKGSNILKIFEAASGGKRLAEVYGITAADDAASQKGAADYFGDLKFSWPAAYITRKLRESGIDAHRFLFDQPNPFAKQPQHAVAYHCVDLFAVFGAYDNVVGEEMKGVGEKLRSNWIQFVYGEQPWSPQNVFAYGPAGKTGEISDEEAASRRHVKRFEVIEEVGFDTTQEIYQTLLSAAESAS